MTIASEITRLQGAKANIKTSIENKGVAVPSNTTIDTYPGYIDQIETIDDSTIAITGIQIYGGMHGVGSSQDIGGLDGCVSYATDAIVLIGYVGNWQTANGYEKKDLHFLRWKKGVSGSSSESINDMGYDTTYSFPGQGISITKEDGGASYLFTVKAKYITDGTSKWRYRGQIRYTVATDTFTNLGTTRQDSVSDPWPDIVDDDMHLYSPSYETTNRTRAALFTLIN